LFVITFRVPIAEPIHLRYVFKVARKATVSLASTVRIMNDPSLFMLTFERLPSFFVSGFKALRIEIRCLSEDILIFTVAFAFILIVIINK